MTCHIRNIIAAIAIIGSSMNAAEPKPETVLPKSQWNPIPNASDRHFWDTLANNPVCREIISEADASLKLQTTPPGEDLYKEFSTNGDRRRYEQAYSRFHAPLKNLTLAACLTGDKKYAAQAMRVIRGLASMKTWMLPAHDRELKNLRQQTVDIDLVSATLGWQVAAVGFLLKPMLTDEEKQLIRTELDKRIVTPFHDMISGKRSRNWWLDTTNNWNIVCLAGVGGILLTAELDPGARDKMLAAVVKLSNNYLAGFGSDGYCSEGIAYWNYGFSNYLYLASALYLASGQQLNLMRRPAAIQAAMFPEHIRINKNIFPAFADSDLNVRIPVNVIAMRDWLLAESPGLNPPLGLSKRANLIEFMLAAASGKPAQGGLEKQQTEDPGFSIFPEAGVLVGRPGNHQQCRLAVAFKGGSNHEFHNHNDVGSYVIAIDGQSLIIVDPGREIYTSRTFSNKRYESKLLNSFGHSVPRINGMLQADGKNTDAPLLEHLNTPDTLRAAFNIRPAYHHIPAIEKLERVFLYDRTGTGCFSVTDHASFSKPMTFENAIITFGSTQSSGPDAIIITDKDKKLKVNIDCGGIPVEISHEFIRENTDYKQIPCRVAIKTTAPVNAIKMKITFTPLE